MIVKGHKLPEKLSNAIEERTYFRNVGSWKLKEMKDSYEYMLETELGELFDSVEKIEKETGDLYKYYVSDGVYGDESEWSNDPGFIEDILDFSKIICFGISADGSPFCLDYRETEIPSVIWWDDVYWRRISPNYDEFVNLFNIPS